MSAGGGTNSSRFWAAAILLPLVAAQLPRLAALSGPAPARAQPQAAETPVASSLPPISKTQGAALAWLNRPEHRSVGDSPMNRFRPKPASDHAVVQVAPVHDDTPDLPTELRVTSIMGRDEAYLIGIDHKTYHIGDEVVAHWRLTRVDSDRRVVVLASDDGKQQYELPFDALHGEKSTKPR